jgi:hypothetical protein
MISEVYNEYCMHVLRREGNDRLFKCSESFLNLFTERNSRTNRTAYFSNFKILTGGVQAV